MSRSAKIRSVSVSSRAAVCVSSSEEISESVCGGGLVMGGDGGSWGGAREGMVG